MSFRNERTLYKRKCDAPGHEEEIISVFSKDKPFIVYDHKYWWSDEWNPLSFGAEYDFSKKFFSQFRELLERIPLLALFNGNAINSDYANHAYDSKNCYLISAAITNENVMYSNRTAKNKDSIDLYLTDKMEASYEDVNCGTSYGLFFSYGCEDCQNSWFLYDCRNCSNCFGCVGLRNKSYYIFNQPYSKEDYKKKLESMNMENFNVIEETRKKHEEMILGFPRKFMYSFKTVNSVGDNLGETKNCSYSFDILDGQDCKFITWGGFGLKDTYDGYGMGMGELMYEIVDAGLQGYNIKFSVVVWAGHDVQYSYNCHNCSNIFGCIGLRNKQYCILNKQYTKEEYEALLPKITEHIDLMSYVDNGGRTYKYGEFFPPEISPFAYNETIAQEYFPLTKEVALNQGFRWKEPENKNYAVTKILEDLPDNIKDVEEEITNEIIGCLHKGKCEDQCATAFRIIPDELSFYKRMNLPLPRFCPNCRHYRRLKQRNPLKLWPRKCQCAGSTSSPQAGQAVYQNTVAHSHGGEHCQNEFETSYAPERPEIVYCENCYNSEVV